MPPDRMLAVFDAALSKMSAPAPMLPEDIVALVVEYGQLREKEGEQIGRRPYEAEYVDTYASDKLFNRIEAAIEAMGSEQ